MAEIQILKGTIPDELFGQLETALKDSKLKLGDLSTGAYISKEKFDAQAAEIKTYKDQVTEANKQIESFKTLDVETIKKTAEEYKTKYEAAESDFKKQLEQRDFDDALNGALMAAKAKNPKAVSALLDKTSLILKDGKLVGLEEQLKTIQEKETYLFEAAGDPPPAFTGKGTPPQNGKSLEDEIKKSIFG